jgi:hypothetical protein
MNKIICEIAIIDLTIIFPSRAKQAKSNVIMGTTHNNRTIDKDNFRDIEKVHCHNQNILHHYTLFCQIII